MAELELNPSRDTQNNRKGFYSKGLSDRVAKPLSRVLERSRHSCEVPDVCEKGNIVPFFRQSGKEDPGTLPYQPPSVPGKVLRQPLLEALLRQHGFTMGKSCLTNPMAFSDGMMPSVDKGRLQMAFTWTAAKPLTQTPTTYCSPHWRDGFACYMD